MESLGSWEQHLKEFYKESIQDNTEYISFIHSENKTMQEIRESHPREWIAELAREIIFNNKKELSLILQEIDYDRSQIQRFTELFRRRQGNIIAGNEPETPEST